MLARACLAQGMDTTWVRHPSLKAQFRGLARADRRSFRVKMGVYRKDLFKFYARRDFDAEFRQLALLSYAFLLRQGSEALPLLRATAGQDLSPFEPLPPGVKGIIGLKQLRNFGTCVVVKLEKRNAFY